jgi:ATP-binding cassette subfamily B protein
VAIDGVDVRDLTLSSLRSQIGVALQESVLFGGTIRDNIRYGRPDAGDAEVEAAARAAQAHEFIATLPGGYGATVGQRGVTLSGGQKRAWPSPVPYSFGRPSSSWMTAPAP